MSSAICSPLPRSAQWSFDDEGCSQLLAQRDLQGLPEPGPLHQTRRWLRFGHVASADSLAAIALLLGGPPRFSVIPRVRNRPTPSPAKKCRMIVSSRQPRPAPAAKSSGKGSRSLRAIPATAGPSGFSSDRQVWGAYDDVEGYLVEGRERSSLYPCADAMPVAE